MAAVQQEEARPVAAAQQGEARPVAAVQRDTIQPPLITASIIARLRVDAIPIHPANKVLLVCAARPLFGRALAAIGKKRSSAADANFTLLATGRGRGSLSTQKSCNHNENENQGETNERN